MITLMPDSSAIAAINPFLARGLISHLPQKAKSVFPDPSVIVNLGSPLPVPLTYNNKGLITSTLSTANVSNVASPAITPPIVVANPLGVPTSLPSTSTNPAIIAQANTANIGQASQPTTNATTPAISPPVVVAQPVPVAAVLPPASAVPAVSAQDVTPITPALSQPTPDVIAPAITPPVVVAQPVTVAATLPAASTVAAISAQDATSNIAAVSQLTSNVISPAITPVIVATDPITVAETLPATSAPIVTPNIPAVSQPTPNATAPVITPPVAAAQPVTVAATLPPANTVPAIDIVPLLALVPLISAQANTPDIAQLIQPVSNATAPAITPAVAAAQPVSVTATLPATSTVPATNAQNVTQNTPVVSQPIPRNLIQEAIAQAQDNITANPVFANAVAGLLVNAAILGPTQSLVSPIENGVYRVKPVSPVTRVSAVKRV